MEICYGCSKDLSTAKERKQRRLLSSSTTQSTLKTLVHFFGVGVDSGRLRKGYICRPCVRLVARYQLVHDEVASNVRKVLPLLPVVGGGASVHVGTSGHALSPSVPPSSAPQGPLPRLSTAPPRPTEDSPALTVSKYLAIVR